MLTQNEKKWLETRGKRPVPCALNESWDWCLNICSGQTLPLRPPCPMVPDYRDAAEFEARVAAELARLNMSMCPCRFCRLKYARLMVEREMEAEYDRTMTNGWKSWIANIQPRRPTMTDHADRSTEALARVKEAPCPKN